MALMLLNPHRSTYGATDRDLIGKAHAGIVRGFLDQCPAHAATPLLSLPALAAESGVAAIHLKAEWARMGLGAFKALGGAYAVARLVCARAEATLGRTLTPADLGVAEVRDIAGAITVTCASAGNHGLSVAAGARAFGAHAVVYLSEAVAESFATRLRVKGAEVVRAGADYDASAAEARAAAERHEWVLVSDSSWPGYAETPLQVMRGYTRLFEEAAEALEADGGPASHVFLQAGVGGLAAAGAAYLRDLWGEDFKLVVVEPAAAPCLLESVRAGRPVRIDRGVTTLGRLDCAEPSLIAFQLLSRLADAFVLILDDEAGAAASRMNALDAPVSPCGAAGAAGLFGLASDASARRALSLGADARVLLVGSEAAEPSADKGDFR